MHLERAEDGEPFVLSRNERAHSALYVAHPGDCPGCADALRWLEARAPALARWDGRAVAILGAGAARGAGDAVALCDAEGRAREALGLDDPESALLLACDRFGQVYAAWRVGRDHALPSPDALETELRGIAIQCPECGVPDEPGRGEWG